MRLKYRHHDGGRAAAGVMGLGSDCVVRALAIALDREYMQVARKLQVTHRLPSIRGGIHVSFWERTLVAHGFVLHREHAGKKPGADTVPVGRCVVHAGRHLFACVDHLVMDMYNPLYHARRKIIGVYVKERDENPSDWSYIPEYVFSARTV